VFTARFFRFLGFLAGAPKEWSGKESDFEVSIPKNLEASIAKDIDEGDWGDGPGEGSVIDDESSETVVVGEDSVESEADVEVLLRGW
jgi:hypothetical protein